MSLSINSTTDTRAGISIDVMTLLQLLSQNALIFHSVGCKTVSPFNSHHRESKRSKVCLSVRLTGKRHPHTQKSLKCPNCHSDPQVVKQICGQHPLAVDTELPLPVVLLINHEGNRGDGELCLSESSSTSVGLS